MTKILALKILTNMKYHEENNLIIFGDKKQNAEALQWGINALNRKVVDVADCLIYGYSYSELKQIIDFAKSRNFNAKAEDK